MILTLSVNLADKDVVSIRRFLRLPVIYDGDARGARGGIIEFTAPITNNIHA